MTSSPPPVRFKILLFGVFVVLVAVVTFMVLYMLKPFEGPGGEPASDKEAPVATPAEEAAQEPAPAKDPAAGKQKPEKPAAASDRPDAPETEPGPGPDGGGPVTVGVPVVQQEEGRWRILFRVDSQARYKHFTLDDPPRLAIDFLEAGYTGQERLLDCEVPFISQIRVGEKPDYTRYVIDFEAGEVPKYELAGEEDGVVLTFSD